MGGIDIPYLRSLAVLAAWEGQSEQAIDHLRAAAQVTADLSLPGEQWPIQAALGTLFEAGGQLAQAQTTFGEAATIIQGLAEGIGNEALRTHFLAAPQIQQVLQQARGFSGLQRPRVAETQGQVDSAADAERGLIPLVATMATRDGPME